MDRAEFSRFEEACPQDVIAAAESVVWHALPFEKTRQIAARIGKYLLFGLAANGVAFGGLALAPYLRPGSGESNPPASNGVTRSGFE